MMWAILLYLLSIHTLLFLPTPYSGIIEEIHRPGHGVCGVPKGCESFRRYNFDVQSFLFFCAFSFATYLTPFHLLL
jgi:hypothetical protein